MWLTVRAIPVVLAALLVGVLAGNDVGTLLRMAEHPVFGPDYLEAAEYVAARHENGQPVLAALTAPVELAGIDREDVVFLPGPLDRQRAQRYTRIDDDGTYRDFWLGAPSTVDVAGLCALLVAHPDAWFVV